MRRSAFTLLETLLAISLTSAVGIAAVSLTTLQARVGTAAKAQEAALNLATETVRLLDEDLLLAVKHPVYGRFALTEDGGLRLTTTCHLPGEAPGLAEVVWRWDAAAGTLLRTSTPLGGGAPISRRVGGGWTAWAISLDQDLLWMDGRIGATGAAWRLPLWSEAP